MTEKPVKNLKRVAGEGGGAACRGRKSVESTIKKVRCQNLQKGGKSGKQDNEL